MTWRSASWWIAASTAFACHSQVPSPTPVMPSSVNTRANTQLHQRVPTRWVVTRVIRQARRLVVMLGSRRAAGPLTPFQAKSPPRSSAPPCGPARLAQRAPMV